MSRHAVLTTVAVTVLSLSVLSSPVLAQDEQPPPRASEDLLARVEALRAKLLADIRASAEAGDALSQYSLGRRYADGDGVPKDAAEAVTWYRLAAEQDLAAAQLGLGLIYAQGELGVPQNPAEAVTWHRRAAEQGLAAAQFGLGLIYAQGELGIPQDPAEGATWVHLAAEQDLTIAQSYLGAMYASGSGVPQNDAEAGAWFRKAAEQGYAEAQFRLGLMYFINRGVTQDYVEAHMWLNLAASRSTGAEREQAVMMRDEVAELLTPAELREAQRRAREWHAAHPVP